MFAVMFRRQREAASGNLKRSPSGTKQHAKLLKL
jgi:hypothetical protein